MIISIYLGQYETAACCIDSSNGSYNDLDILPGCKIIRSAVCKLSDNTVFIGDHAILNSYCSTVFFNGFSECLSKMDTKELEMFQLFLKGVYNALLSNLPEESSIISKVILVKQSSDFWIADKSLLKAIAERLGLPSPIIIKSSIAAWCNSISQPDSRIDNTKECLLCEFGYDNIRYAVFGKQKEPIEYIYYHLGVKRICQLIFEYVINNPQDSIMPQIKELIESGDLCISDMLFRKVEKTYMEYSDYSLPSFDLLLDYTLLTSLSERTIQGYGGVRLDSKQIDSVLIEYHKDLSTLNEYVKGVLLSKGYIVDSLFLLNDAHRSIKEIFKKYFSVIEEDYPHPLLAAQGGCMYAIATEGFRKEIQIDYLQNSNSVKIKNMHIRPITESTEFIIGIDFGHGETSASFYNILNEEKEDLDILPGKKVVKSAVAILKQEGVETICIGDSAIQQAPLADDFQVSFKKRPSEMNEKERERMVKFMRGVYQGILDRHPDYKNRDHRVFIARPSQDKLWLDEEDAYVAIASDAGIPVAGIQKESRSAYFRARTQPDSKIDKQVAKGVLIVDFGSSTIDFTYLNKDLAEPIDDGVNLGANAVEIALLKYALDHPQESTMSKFAHIYGDDIKSNAYNQMLYKFRVAKEEFYGSNLPTFQVMVDYNLLTSSEKAKPHLVGFGGFTLSRDEVNSILNDTLYGNYIPSVEAAVKEFKEKKLKNNTVVCVYLTGGASRMDFVREIFMKVFGLSADKCPSDETPSLIVSQGVAHLSYADYKTEGRAKELRKKVEKILNDFNWNGELKSVIFPIVQSEIKSRANSVMVDWRDGKITGVGESDYVCPTIEALIKRFKSTFEGYESYNFAEASKEMIKNQVLDKVVKKIRETFSDYQYKEDFDSVDLNINISVKLWYSGVKKLVDKFTAEGNGHIIYDAVDASTPFGMTGWNLKRHRSVDALKRHYDHYPYSIFSDQEWKSFLNDGVRIEGVDPIKNEIKTLVEKLMDSYISYARLAIFTK